MNWLEFITEKDFKKNLPAIFEERTGCRFLKASVKKINDEKFGTCFLCDVEMEESGTKFINTMKFGQYGLIDENINQYEYGVDYKEFVKFMILSLKNKNIDSNKYVRALISDHQFRLLRKRNTSIKELTESTQTNIQERLLNLDKIFNPILIKANVLNKKQENFIDYTDKNWIDLIDLKSFKEQALRKLLDDLSVKPNEVIETKKEFNKELGSCIVIETHKVSDYYGKYGYVYGESDIIQSYNYEYKFAKFGLIDNTTENKYAYDYRHLTTNEIFCKFMINETMGKTINHKTFADELNTFVEQQKQLIEQEGLDHLQKNIKVIKKHFADEIKRDSEEIARKISYINFKSDSIFSM